MDLAHYHVATYRAGEGGFYKPLRPNHFEVIHDSKRYIYERPRSFGRPIYTARDARSFIARAWDRCGDRLSITGRWPSYTVE